MSLQPASFKLQLRKDEATLLLLAFDSGIIHLDTFNTTSVAIFGMKPNEERHKKMMDGLFKFQKELTSQLYEKKSDIFVK